MSKSRQLWVAVLLLSLTLPSASLSLAEETAVAPPEGRFPFRPGELLGPPDLERFREQMPPELWRWRASVFPDDLSVVAGQPSPRSAADAPDCQGDPETAARAIWNLARSVGPGLPDLLWSYAYWDRERGDGGLTDDARGVTILSYREREQGTAEVDAAQPADFWIYLPGRSRAAESRPPPYSWSCVGAQDVFAPAPPPVLSGEVPEPRESWALREAWVIRFEQPERPTPFDHGVLYVDRASYQPLYAMVFDVAGRLTRIAIGDRRRIDAGRNEED